MSRPRRPRRAQDPGGTPASHTDGGGRNGAGHEANARSPRVARQGTHGAGGAPTTDPAESHTRRPRIAYQGVPGAFGEAAARQAFGRSGTPTPCAWFTDVIAAVRDRTVDYGVLPVHNTIVGPIAAACAALEAGGVVPIGEVLLPIRQLLLGPPGAALDGVRRVLSHPAALGQCRRFLAAHPALLPVETDDTAGSAREVARRGDPAIAAIAGEAAARRYGLAVLAHDVHDRADNDTRFLVLAPHVSTGP